MRTPHLQRALPMVVLLACLAFSPALAQVDKDQDGDGWTPQQGDSCDVPTALCINPRLVNPGAFEVPNNGIDDDCNGVVDDTLSTACSLTNNFTGNSLELVKALDLCQFTTSNPPPNLRKWGVLSASLLRSAGTSGLVPSSLQTAVETAFGTQIHPRANATLAVLSSGTARTFSQPGYMPPVSGWTDGFAAQAAPAAWLSANGGAMYSSPPCPPVPSIQTFNSVLLRLVVRVPTNANGFTFKHRLLSAQYPDTCTGFNDHALCLVNTIEPGIPDDKNVLLGSNGRHMTVQDAPFVANSPDLAGTGYPPEAGLTDWTTSGAALHPGEVVTIEFHIWDAGDDLYDASLLLDDFRWNLIIPGTIGVADMGAPDPGLRVTPNPFRSTAALDFRLVSEAHVVVDVFDVAGRRVRRIDAGLRPAGEQRVAWDGRDDAGGRVRAGAYFARVDTGDRVMRKRLIYLD